MRNSSVGAIMRGVGVGWLTTNGGGRRLLLMSAQENKEIALNVIEALNARDLSVWSQHLAEDYKAEHPGVSVPLNKTKSVGYYQRFVTAFPDIHFEVLHVLAEGDHVLIHWRGSGTHTERLATVTGETIPPTRRRMRVSGSSARLCSCPCPPPGRPAPRPRRLPPVSQAAATRPPAPGTLPLLIFF